jgi:1-hydroxycarotenoid 3,4-desaturase
VKEVVVIGAGIGGLSAALSLVARGQKVRVLEAHDRPGGKAGVVEIQGIEVDTGPSVLTLPEVFDRLFRLAGSSLSAELELLEPSPAFDYRWPDGTRLKVEVRPEATRAEVRASLGPEAEQELQAFLQYAGEIWATAAPHFVYGPAPTASQMLGLGLGGLKAVGQIDALSTMGRAIEQRVRNPYLRDLLGRYATYNGSDLRAAPATLNCIAHVELNLGAFGVRGGIHQLVEALARRFVALGGVLETGARVERIVVEGKRVVGVALVGGRRVEADQVIANADAAHVFGQLLPGKLGRKLSPNSTPSTSGWTCILKRRRRDGLAAHTVLFPERYRAEFEDLFDHQRPPVDPTVYLCAQERAHQRPGWPEHEPVFVMANAPAQPEFGPTEPFRIEALGAKVLSRLRTAGLYDPELDEVVWSRGPAELAAAFPGSRGGIYGAASNSTFAAFRRPANRIREVPGLYLASGSAHPGGGLPLCALSGQTAADAVLEDAR